MIEYATLTDLQNWDSTVTPPADAAQLLRSASIIIARSRSGAGTDA